MNNSSNVSFEQLSHQEQAVELLQRRVALYKAKMPTALRAKKAFELRMCELVWAHRLQRDGLK